jgi:hypothetical protein
MKKVSPRFLLQNASPRALKINFNALVPPRRFTGAKSTSAIQFSTKINIAPKFNFRKKK